MRTIQSGKLERESPVDGAIPNFDSKAAPTLRLLRSLPHELVQDRTALRARNSQQASLVAPHSCFVRTFALRVQWSLSDNSCATLSDVPHCSQGLKGHECKKGGTPRRRQLLAVTRGEDVVAALRTTALQLRRLRT